MASTFGGESGDAFVGECDPFLQLVNDALVVDACVCGSGAHRAVGEEEARETQLVDCAATLRLDSTRRRIIKLCCDTADTGRASGLHRSRPASVRCTPRGRRGRNGSPISHRSIGNVPGKLCTQLSFDYLCYVFVFNVCLFVCFLFVCFVLLILGSEGNAAFAS